MKITWKYWKNIEKHSGNMICARFIKSGQAISKLFNLKVGFGKVGEYVEIQISFNGNCMVDDLHKISKLEKDMKGNERCGNRVWMMIYEWDEKECLLIKVDKIEMRDDGVIVMSDKLWLMEQKMSVYEIAMRRLLKNI